MTKSAEVEGEDAPKKVLRSFDVAYLLHLYLGMPLVSALVEGYAQGGLRPMLSYGPLLVIAVVPLMFARYAKREGWGLFILAMLKLGHQGLLSFLVVSSTNSVDVSLFARFAHVLTFMWIIYIIAAFYFGIRWFFHRLSGVDRFVSTTEEPGSGKRLKYLWSFLLPVIAIPVGYVITQGLAKLYSVLVPYDGGGANIGLGILLLFLWGVIVFTGGILGVWIDKKRI